MKRLLFIVFVTMSLTVLANDALKVVAILPTVDVEGNVGYGVKFQLRASLTYAINMTPGYMGVDRVDMSSIMNEQSFQRTGAVNNDQIKKLGDMAGAQYVLIAEAALYDAQNIIIAAKILDVETGGVVKSTPASTAGKDPEKMQAACVKVAKTLLGVSSSIGGTGGSGVGSYPPSYGNRTTNQDFTEDAGGINMKMIWVEGGEFMMGCTSEQSGCSSDEQNVRRVTVDGFYIGMLEVTQSQWEKVMGTSVYQQRDKANTSWSMRGVGPDYPIYYVNWEEATEFCRLLSNKTGRTYTLPTEAQWEYAARGGKKNEETKYAGSNMIDAVAWYTDNSGSSTHPCGTKRANALGIYDMSGNVWEWCKDWYSSSYTSYDTNNPTGPSSGSNRVLRGGCWNSNATICRVAHRNGNTPTFRNYDCGFRVVCIP